VAQRLLSVFFLMATVPLVVFILVDLLELGNRVLGPAVSGDAITIVVAAVAALSVAYFLGHRMAKSITVPLGRLAEAADELGRGSVPATLAVTGDDEFARLAESFNAMAGRITVTISDLNTKLQRLSTELFYLSSLGATVQEASDPASDLRRLAPRLRTLLNSEFVWVYLVYASELRLVGYEGDATARAQIAVEECARAALHRHEPVDGGFSSMTGRLTTAARAAWGPVASAMAAPIQQQGESVGAIVAGSQRPYLYTADNKLLLASVTTQVALLLSFSEAFVEIEDAFLKTVTVLSGSVEEQDRYPRSHPDALAGNAMAVGRLLRLSDQQLRRLRYCALLHDVGKAAVRGAVLDKAGPLDAAELEEMRRHAVAGETLVAGISFLAPVAPMVRATHERWDGRGYPDGLKGEAIPIEARIVLVCDAFEALTHDRPYRAAMSLQQAQDELRACAGTQFDPAVVDVFVGLSGLAVSRAGLEPAESPPATPASEPAVPQPAPEP